MSVYPFIFLLLLLYGVWGLIGAVVRLFDLIYPASRGFFLAWLLACTCIKSFSLLVIRVVGLFTPSEKPLQGAVCGFHCASTLGTSKFLKVGSCDSGFKAGFN